MPEKIPQPEVRLKTVAFLIILAIAIFLRFYNLNWGNGFFFNPDERNMARAVNQMCFPPQATCSLYPDFFAYGQFPLYLAFFSGLFFNLLRTGHLTGQVTFPEAIFWLRFWSALISSATVIMVYLISTILAHRTAFGKELKSRIPLVAMLLTAFTPGLIQGAHFGTTESLLTFFFITIVYLSSRHWQIAKRTAWLKRFKKAILSLTLKSSKKHLKQNKHYLTTVFLAIIFGLAMATKLSAIYFFAPIIFTLIRLPLKNWLIFVVVFWLTFVVASPYSFLEFSKFWSISRYEMDVATGKAQVFYTRQYLETAPILFQVRRVFPYALGLPLFLFGAIGFIIFLGKAISSRLRVKTGFEETIPYGFILILAFLVYFIPNSLLFTKWVRFMTPILPFFSIFTIFIVISHFLKRTNLLENLFGFLIIISCLIPGVSFFSRVYAQADTRLQASQWIYKNLPNQSYLLSEGGNVLDIPLSTAESNPEQKQYQVINFDFYNLDEKPELLAELIDHLEKADYIIIPSRRIFANHLRLPLLFPISKRYYNNLVNGNFGFALTKTISVSTNGSSLKVPRKNSQTVLPLLGDEAAEETWSVFDHPTIRIFKKVSPHNRSYYENLLLD